jgi:hypothetical protein
LCGYNRDLVITFIASGKLFLTFLSAGLIEQNSYYPVPEQKTPSDFTQITSKKKSEEKAA